MKDNTNGKLSLELEYAKSIDEISLQQCIAHLEEMEGTVWCKEIEIYNDFAPRSFYFIRRNPKGEFCGDGGIIFHGEHDRGGDGGPPTFSVSINPKLRNHWDIHT